MRAMRAKENDAMRRGEGEGDEGRVGGGASRKSIPNALNPACVPAVHDARNVSPTDPNPMDDIAAAHAARHMSSRAKS